MSIRESKATTNDLQAHLAGDPKVVHGIWTEFLKRIPTMITPADDITDKFSWAGAWENIDLSAETASYARWAILSFDLEKTGDYRSPIYIGPYGTTVDANRIITLGSSPISSHDYLFGGVHWIPMDGFQRFAALTQSALTTKYVYLIGYCG